MSAGLRAGYKQTDLGPVPEDWDVVSMGDVSDCLIGLTYSPMDVHDFGTLVLRSSNVQDSRLTFNDNVYVEMDIPPRAITQKDDILICVRNGSRQLIGKCTLIDERTAGSAFGAFMSVLRSDSPPFLLYQFQSEIVKRQINEVMGATINQITNKDLATFKVIWPSSKAEQEAIAEALSDADALIESLDQLITKKRNLKQAAMQPLLTGQTRLPGFSGEWEVKRLGELGECLRGVTYKGDTDLSPHDTSQTKRLLRSNNVQSAVVVIEDIQFVNSDRVSARQLLKASDILICMANGSKALVGKAGLFNVHDGYDYTFGAFMGCFRSNSAASNPRFVFYLFQTGRYRNYINNLLAGSSINNLSPGSIESLEFPVPTMSEQTAIATIISDMDAELAELEARLAKARYIKQGMMQELLTGRIRLL
jgi:type I restriction enzyme, S subunit